MKPVFNSNKKWRNTSNSVIGNIMVFILLLFVLVLYVENVPELFVSVLFGILFFLIVLVLVHFQNAPCMFSVTDCSFLFYFPLQRVVVCYCLVFQFIDNFRIPVPSIKIEKYSEFVAMAKNNGCDYSRFTRHNNWINKNKSFSENNVKAGCEADLVLSAGNENGVINSRFVGTLIASVSLILLYFLIFKV